jgi:hypothetical protein
MKKKTTQTQIEFLLLLVSNRQTNSRLYHNTLHILTDTDTTELITLAKHHGLLPIIYKKLYHINKEYYNKYISNFYKELKSQYIQISKYNMLLSSELINIFSIFQANNIKALSFKGATLSTLLYDDITIRQYSDIDILIKLEDRKKVLDILQQHKYKEHLNLPKEQKELFLQTAKEISLYHIEKPIMLDIHWAFFDKDYPIDFDCQDIWKEPFIVRIDNLPIPTFNKEQLLIYLAIHASKHLFERIEWLVDIDRAITTHNIDWSYIYKFLQKSDFERMFILALYLSNRHFDTYIPNRLLHKYKDEKWLSYTSDYVIKSWYSDFSITAYTKAMLYLFPKTSQKINYLIKVIFKPSKNEFNYIKSDKKWLYYTIRPWLLIKKYLF